MCKRECETNSVQPGNKLFPGAPEPSSAGEESQITNTLPVPKVDEAHITFVVLCAEPVFQISPFAAVVVVVNDAPAENLRLVTVPKVPFKWGL